MRYRQGFPAYLDKRAKLLPLQHSDHPWPDRIAPVWDPRIPLVDLQRKSDLWYDTDPHWPPQWRSSATACPPGQWLLFNTQHIFALRLLMLLIIRAVCCEMSVSPKRKNSVQPFIAHSRWFIAIEKFLLRDLLIPGWLNSQGCASLICWHLRAETD